MLIVCTIHMQIRSHLNKMLQCVRTAKTRRYEAGLHCVQCCGALQPVVHYCTGH